MANRKTKKVRKGGGKLSQGLRFIGAPTYASTKQAAFEIKNIYANLKSDETDSYKPEIDDIVRRNFGPSIYTPKDRILRELHKFGHGSLKPPKNWMRSMTEIREWYK